MVSEQEFYLINGNKYRGSRYSNFAGAGVDPQGNVSSAANENAANSAATYTDGSGGATATPTGGGNPASSVSEGLVSDGSEAGGAAPSYGQMARDVVIGGGIPYAANKIGSAAGRAIGVGATTSAGLQEGVSALSNKVSMGLIGGTSGLGAGASATNAALAARGANFGPATQGAVNTASNSAGAIKGANVGSAIGAGFGTAAATLLTGGSVKDAVKGGLGSAAGTYIGTALGGPIGGFIGGTIGSLFCFGQETPILMQDGTTKRVADIRLMDEVLGGGTVTAWGEAFADDVYLYKNTVVTGSHAVFEDGEWIRVEDTEEAIPMIGEKVIVCPLETENRLLITPWFVSADITEVPKTWEYSEEERISVLNQDVVRNESLLKLEGEVCVGIQ